MVKVGLACPANEAGSINGGADGHLQGWMKLNRVLLLLKGLSVSTCSLCTNLAVLLPGTTMPLLCGGTQRGSHHYFAATNPSF